MESVGVIKKGLKNSLLALIKHDRRFRAESRDGVDCIVLREFSVFDYVGDNKLTPVPGYSGPVVSTILHTPFRWHILN